MKTQTRMQHRLQLALTVATAGLVLLPTMAEAGNWTTRNVSELVAAINAANAAGGVNTITLTPGKTFTLTAVNNNTDGPTGLPVIAANNKLTICGNGATIMRSAMLSTPAFRIFDVAAGASLTLKDLTIGNGRIIGDVGMDGCGGAILVATDGTLAVKCSTFVGNQVVGGDGEGYQGGFGFGGAVYSDGIATFDGVIFRGNRATGGDTTNPDGTWPGGQGVGGAIGNDTDGTLKVRNCWFAGNKAIGGLRHEPSNQFDALGKGGAIDNYNIALITDCVFSENEGMGGASEPDVEEGGYGAGGAIFSGGQQTAVTEITIQRCIFSRNRAVGADAGPASIGGTGWAGAVHTGWTREASSATITDCSFVANQSVGGIGGTGGWGQDGAIIQESPSVGSPGSATLTIARCTFNGNKAVGGSPGGAGQEGAVGNTDWDPDRMGAGAILAISDCTFSGNEARGATGGDGSVDIAPGSAHSGAVDSDGNATILRCMFRDNRVIGGSLSAGATPNWGTASYGGGLSSWGGTLHVADCSFVGNQVIGAAGETGVAGSAALGGAIEIGSGLPAIILNCRISDNVTIGGVGGSGAAGGTGAGGGIDIELNPWGNAVGPSTALTLTGTTISRNQAIGGANGGVGMGGGYSVGTAVLFGIPDNSTVMLNGGSKVINNQPDNVFQF